MPLTAVTATAQLLLSFKKALNDAREHAETSKDIQLKQHINSDGDRQRLVRLSPLQSLQTGGERRSCPVCKETFYETRGPPLSSARRKPYSSRGTRWP